MELCQGGELFDRIAECGGLPEDEARRYFVHIVSALHHCHQNQVYHRDLKPENILLDGQDNAKVADFGLAAVYRHMNDDARYLRHTKVGSVMYAAPEVLTSTAQAGYDAAAADMWSLGIILFSMLSGTLPFQCAAASRCKRYAAVLQQGIQVMCPDTLSPDVTALLARMIHPDPKQRYTPEEALQCAWLGQKSQGAGEEARGVCGRGASDTAVDAQPRGAPPDAQPRSWTILLQLPEQRAPELGPPPSALHPDAGAQKRKRDEGDASSAPQPPGPGDFAVPLPPITAALLNRTEPDTQPRLESRDEGDGADGEASSATGAREATPSSSSNPLAALPLTGCLTECVQLWGWEPLPHGTEQLLRDILQTL
jgi:serine/threonine protein kinase